MGILIAEYTSSRERAAKGCASVRLVRLHGHVRNIVIEFNVRNKVEARDYAKAYRAKPVGF